MKNMLSFTKKNHIFVLYVRSALNQWLDFLPAFRIYSSTRHRWRMFAFTYLRVKFYPWYTRTLQSYFEYITRLLKGIQFSSTLISSTTAWLYRVAVQIWCRKTADLPCTTNLVVPYALSKDQRYAQYRSHRRPIHNAQHCTIWYDQCLDMLN